VAAAVLLLSTIRPESSASCSAGRLRGVVGGVLIENCNGAKPPAAAAEEEEDDDDDDDAGIGAVGTRGCRMAVCGKPLRSCSSSSLSASISAERSAIFRFAAASSLSAIAICR